MLLLLFSVPSSFLTVSALYKLTIGLSSLNFVIAIELIISQSLFLGVKIALSFSIVPEKTSGKTIFINDSGVLGKFEGICKLSGILIEFVLGILSNNSLFSPTSIKNLEKLIAENLYHLSHKDDKISVQIKFLLLQNNVLFVHSHHVSHFHPLWKGTTIRTYSKDAQ